MGRVGGRSVNPAVEILEAILQGPSKSTAALCLCDDADQIRYANPAFRAAFLSASDGCPADFMTAIVAAIESGVGIRVMSASLNEFAAEHRQRRRTLIGSRNFLTDLIDGSWWTVTDTKMPNGWILVVAQEISNLKDEEARLREAHETALVESQTDFLTGVPNRRHGLQRAEALWAAARHQGIDLSLALLDMDHFKAINDAYGHDAGDMALLHFSRYMMQVLEPEDQFSRLGGDEFMLVSAHADRGKLETILTRVLAAMPNVPLPGQCEGLPLSISVGVARSRVGETWPRVMHRADMALYKAKSSGRNRIEADSSRQTIG